MFVQRFIMGNLWSAVLIFLTLILKKLLSHRTSLRFQYGCWFVPAVSLLLPFFPDSLWTKITQIAFSRKQTMASFRMAESPAPDPVPAQQAADAVSLLLEEPDTSLIETVFLVIWLAGVTAFMVYYLCGSFWLRQIRRNASAVDPEVQRFFDRCCQKPGIRRRVEIRQSRLIVAPVSFGCRKPLVVLPQEKLAGLSMERLRHVLLHELAHIRHGDLISNGLFCTLQAFCWFNPMVWLAFRQMRRDREAYCDWAVLKELKDEDARMDYGQTILYFAAGYRTRFCTANGLCQNKDHLKYRLCQIVDYQDNNRQKKRTGRRAAVTLAILCVFQIPSLSFCTGNQEEYCTPPPSSVMSEGDWQDFFEGTDGCAVVYDRSTQRYTVYNEKEITHRMPPCSTFKIYSALNALEQRLITPENNLLSWDGTPYELSAWNRNQTLETAMQQSVNWYFQRLDQTAGAAELSQFYRRIHYGNAAGIKNTSDYWNGSALKISALEQVDLLVKLYSNEWGFDDENIEAVKSSLLLSVSNDIILYGKTGTGKIGSTSIAGWFVGFAEQAGNTRFFAVYLCSGEGADGAAAAQIAKRILNSMNPGTVIPVS